MWISDVVGQLELMKRNAWPVHPLLSGSRRVWVHIHSLWKLRISFARHHPPCIVIFVTSGKAETISYAEESSDFEIFRSIVDVFSNVPRLVGGGDIH